MAADGHCYDSADEDYIDMEVSTFTSFFSNSREFEFQMSACPLQKDSTTSPADELFYKGKLLPLHLPPRLEMVEELLQRADSFHGNKKTICDDLYSATPFMTTAVTTPTATSTPFESCTASPSESCQVSRELNPDECFVHFSTELGGDGDRRKSWTKRLKQIKQTSLGSKLRASKAYLRSFFGISGCSHEPCTSASKVVDEGLFPKAMQPINKISFGEIPNHKYNRVRNTAVRNVNKEKINGFGCHRRSFSTSIKPQAAKKLPSPSSSSIPQAARKGFHPFHYLKRSSSTNSDVESSIQGAIAHCKQSQQTAQTRKMETQAGFYPLSTSGIAVLNHERV